MYLYNYCWKSVEGSNMADEFKRQGNEAFASKNYEVAIEAFTKAIELDPANHVLFSNRSAAYASVKKYAEAYDDAVTTTEIKPDWAKGWNRKGAASHGLGYLQEAQESYENALKYDPENSQAKTGISSVQSAIDAGEGTGGLGNMFNDPQLIAKLAANPKTAPLLADAEFMNKLTNLKNDPNGMQSAFADPRLLQVLGVLMGVDIQTGPEAYENAMGSGKDEKSVPPQKPAPVDETDEAKTDRLLKEEADREKQLGNVAYKNRDFDAAVEHYQNAWDKNPDITYLNNMATTYFEKGDFAKCIEASNRAIDEGRDRMADFKVIAKAFARIAAVHGKQEDYGKAIQYYQKSLTEHRNPDVVTKLRNVEKLKFEADKKAYLSPEKAEEAREEGNKYFKEGNWPEAIKSYNEMIKRNPNDIRGYSNRAAAFIKLLSFPDAIKDCDKALEIDATFIRGHIRKASALFGMRDYSKAIDCCRKASELDTGNAHTGEISALSNKCMTAMYSNQQGETEEQVMERVSRDPEIMSIMQDPVMQSILQQAQSDPAALQEHMKSPMIKEKIQKLMAAGIIKVGSR